MKGSKISLVTDEAGLPFDLRTDSGQRHDLYACGSLVERIPPNSIVVADRGYDAKWFRRKIKKCGSTPKIPKRSWKRSHKDPIARLGRWKVERCIAWLGKYRKLEVRYERLLSHYTAFWFLACSALLLRKLTE